MKYQPEQHVILLDMQGRPAYNAVVRNYEPSTKLYRINYEIPGSQETWVDNVLEERLMILTDAAKNYSENKGS